MKVLKVESVGKQRVFDISVGDAEHYILENGVVTHNTGQYYSAQTIFMIGRSQEKEGTEITGWNFTLNIDKSRFVKEKSKLTFQVKYDGGIDRYSGLFDLALESGHLVKSGSRYQLVDFSTGEVTEPKVWGKDIPSDFYESLLADKKFGEFVRSKFMLASKKPDAVIPSE